MNDPRDVRLSAALRAEGARARPRDDCPAPDRIWSAVRSELPQAERLAILDHLAECPACVEAWQLAMEMGARQDVPPRAAVPPQRSGWTNRLRAWPLAAAAVLVLAIGVVQFVRQAGPAVDPIERNAAGEMLEPRDPPGESYPRDDVRLRWTPGPAGSRYDLVVTTPELDVLVDARNLESTEYHVPPERLAGVGAGAPLLWRVVARTPDGTTIASPTVEVSVR